MSKRTSSLRRKHRRRSNGLMILIAVAYMTKLTSAYI